MLYNPESNLSKQLKIRREAAKTGRWPVRTSPSKICDYYDVQAVSRSNIAEQAYLNALGFFERIKILAEKARIECETNLVWNSRVVAYYLNRKGRCLK